MEEKNPIQVADRLFGVLELLAEKGAMGLMEISKEMNLNKSTVHRILNSLIYMGYVKQNDMTSQYMLTYKICTLSERILKSVDLVDLAHPFLKELSFRTGETVHLVQRDGTNAVYIDKVETDTNTVRLISSIGKTIPLYCSGVGKAMLAGMEESSVRKIWNFSEIKAYTDKTIVDIDSLLRELKIIRERGYSVDDEENEIGVRCVAVALDDYRGKPNYAISISAPEIRMKEERMRELAGMLLETKRILLEANA